MKIKTKLLSGFLCVAVITLIVGSIAWWALGQLSGELNKMGNNSIPAIVAIEEIGRSMIEVKVVIRTLAVPTTSMDDIERQFANIEKARERYVSYLDAYEKMPKTQEETALYKVVKDNLGVIKEKDNKYFAYAKNLLRKDLPNKDPVFRELGRMAMQELRTPFDDFLASVLALLDYVQTYYGKQKVKEALTLSALMNIIIVISTIAGIFVASILALYFGNLLTKPILSLVDIFKQMATGDLTRKMEALSKDEFGTLAVSYNSSVDSINELLSQVSSAIEQVSAGSTQVSQASQSLSQGAAEQASSLEEITSSVTEINSQTKQNTESAIQVNGLARTAKDNAEQGDRQMKALVTAMEQINTSAGEIKKIVKAIDDIAFQINLLALNANVEAARAGKYGKGFAVVAEEVRNLAVRSANSVKETTTMVDVAIKNIENGNALVEVTSKQLNEIVGGASKVADLAEEVATASKEQTQGLDQISTGLGQIDEVTQANTANAEESASAAEELAAQAQQLRALVSKFKLRIQENSGRELKNLSPDILNMIKKEIAKEQEHRALTPGELQIHSHLNIHPASNPEEVAVAEKKEVKTRNKEKPVNPKTIIALDDDNFGKF